MNEETPVHLRVETTSGGGPGAIGPYHLLRVLGEGGFGVVYLAERREPFVQAVAIKVLKAGIDSPSVAARFELERQALALMDHPNLARVIDGGVTGASSSHALGVGRPYLVMELVAGKPIDEYCREQGLGIRERLELFIRVCEAVQHAHTKGVVHRDLKPSNILVSVDPATGEATPKVIDFGVAKALAGSTLETQTMTGQGLFVGTPEYMSPEQAAGRRDDGAGGAAADIDTRTDVYSLGVVLYQLLTGVLPFDRDELWKMAVLEMMRYIREVDPPKPSTRAAGLSRAALKSGTAVAADRGDGGSLPRRLRGDLDWIVMRAMEKSRERRYQSPAELAADIRRHLRTEPVEAGPPSATYRASKFVRRRRALVAASTVSIAAIVIGLVVAVHQRNAAVAAERAERGERLRAEAANRFVLRAVQFAQPQGRDDQVTVLDLTDAMVELLRTGDMDRQLGDRVAVRQLIGAVYRDLKELDAAEEQLLAVLADLDAMGAEADARERLEAEIALARVDADRRRFEPSLERLDDVLARLRRSKDRRTEPLIAEAQLSRGAALLQLGRREEAERALRESIERWSGDEPWERQAIVNPLTVLALVVSESPGGGRGGEAIELAERAVEAAIATTSATSPVTQMTLNNKGRVLRNLGDLDGAIASYTEALGVAESLRTTPRVMVSTMRMNIAQALMEAGGAERLRRAQEYARSAAEILREVAPGSAQLGLSLAVTGMIAMEAGDARAAEALFREDLAIARDGNSDLSASRALTGLADALVAQAEGAAGNQAVLKEAEAAAREALAIRTARMRAGDWRIMSTRSVLGAAIVRQAEPGSGRFAEGLGMLTEAAESLAADPATTPARLRPVALRLIAALEKAGRAEEARAWRRRVEGGA